MRVVYLIILISVFSSLNGQSIFKDTSFIDITIELCELGDGPLSDYDIFLIHDNNDTIMNRHINDTLPVHLLLKDTCNYQIALYKPCFFFRTGQDLKSSYSVRIKKGTYVKTTPYWKKINFIRGCCLTHPDPINFEFNESTLDNKNLRTLFNRIEVIESRNKWKFKFRIISLKSENKLISKERLNFLKSTFKSLDINLSQIEFEEKIIEKSDPDFKSTIPCVQLLITSMD